MTHKFSHWSSRVNYSIKTIIPNKSLLTYNRFGYDNNMRTPNTPSFSKISQKRNSLKCLSETHLLQVRYNFNFVERERERAWWSFRWIILIRSRRDRNVDKDQNLDAFFYSPHQLRFHSIRYNGVWLTNWDLLIGSCAFYSSLPKVKASQ